MQSILRVISEFLANMDFPEINHQKMLDLSLHHHKGNKEVLYSKNHPRLVIPRYEVLTGGWEGEVEPITMLETRSHPPEMNSCMLLYIFLIRTDNRL